MARATRSPWSATRPRRTTGSSSPVRLPSAGTWRRWPGSTSPTWSGSVGLSSICPCRRRAGRARTDDHVRTHLERRGPGQQLHVGGSLRSAHRGRCPGPTERARALQAAPPRARVSPTKLSRADTPRSCGSSQRRLPQIRAAGTASSSRPTCSASIRRTDVMIADVSSVALDHLYLRPESPLVMTDRRSARARLLVDAPVAAAAHVVDDSTVHALERDLAALIADDRMRAARDAGSPALLRRTGPGREHPAVLGGARPGHHRPRCSHADDQQAAAASRRNHQPTT